MNLEKVYRTLANFINESIKGNASVSELQSLMWSIETEVKYSTTCPIPFNIKRAYSSFKVSSDVPELIMYKSVCNIDKHQYLCDETRLIENMHPIEYWEMDEKDFPKSVIEILRNNEKNKKSLDYSELLPNMWLEYIKADLIGRPQIFYDGVRAYDLHDLVELIMAFDSPQFFVTYNSRYVPLYIEGKNAKGLILPVALNKEWYEVHGDEPCVAPYPKEYTKRKLV